MARFAIERGEPLDIPERWDPVGEVDASGEEAVRDAISQVAKQAGFRRVIDR
jgi:hypothetical protein